MAKTPYLPLYYNDLRGATQDWTDEEFGAYVRLLIYQWDKGYIPEEMERLIKIADSAQKNWPVLCKKFTPASNGSLKNSVMENIYTKTQNFAKKQSENVKKRWKNEKLNRRKLNAETVLADDTKSIPKTYPRVENEYTVLNTEVYKEEKKEKIKEKKEEIELPFTSESFRVSWQEWKDYRLVEHGRKFKSPKTEQTALSHLAKIAGGKGSRAEEIIAQSIGNQWQGLFPLKNSTNGNRNYGKATGAHELLEELRANSGTKQG